MRNPIHEIQPCRLGSIGGFILLVCQMTVVIPQYGQQQAPGMTQGQPSSGISSEYESTSFSAAPFAGEHGGEIGKTSSQKWFILCGRGGSQQLPADAFCCCAFCNRSFLAFLMNCAIVEARVEISSTPMWSAAEAWMIFGAQTVPHASRLLSKNPKFA